MLTLNDCGIVSLEHFPNLPALIRLDLVFNNIPGDHLQYLQNSKHLQTLMLGANKIESIEQLRPFTNFRQLLQLDLINNPIQKISGYRNLVFTLLPKLTILDTLDKGGKDAYTNSTMMEAVSRVPDALFDKSKPLVLPPISAPTHHVHKAATSKLKKALSRHGSLDSASVHGKATKIKKAPVISRGKYGKSKVERKSVV